MNDTDRHDHDSNQTQEKENEAQNVVPCNHSTNEQENMNGDQPVEKNDSEMLSSIFQINNSKSFFLQMYSDFQLAFEKPLIEVSIKFYYTILL